jgi:serine/threonine-protein kinase SRPK3
MSALNRDCGELSTVKNGALFIDSDSDDCEDPKGYKSGGYHPVNIGDRYSGNMAHYTVIEKLGWGHFSTVWMCSTEPLSRDGKNNLPSHIALKIVKSKKNYARVALDEINILSIISNANPRHPGYGYVVRMFESFSVVGPHGKHICMVFEVLDHNLLKMIQGHSYQGIPLHIVKRIARQILQGLDYLHNECGVIHTDLKPENILYKTLRFTGNFQPLSLQEKLGNMELDASVQDKPNFKDSSISSIEEVSVKIADLGNACFIKHHFTQDIQTREYRCPEVILGGEYGASADIWSCACVIFELVTGDLLFTPQKTKNFSKDADHIAQIIELLGYFPLYLRRGKFSNYIFDKRGSIKGIYKLNIWPLDRVLMERYHIDPCEAQGLFELLIPMLHLDPKKRATAKECLNSPWLM